MRDIILGCLILRTYLLKVAKIDTSSLLPVSCPTINLTVVIPSEAKESRFEIATSHTLLAMTMYRSVRDRTIAY